jgi:hypothetical protein
LGGTETVVAFQKLCGVEALHSGITPTISFFSPNCSAHFLSPRAQLNGNYAITRHQNKCNIIGSPTFKEDYTTHAKWIYR